MTVIQRSLKRSNCEAFEVSDLSDLSGGRFAASSAQWPRARALPTAAMLDRLK
jgi:hypothetical protein